MSSNSNQQKMDEGKKRVDPSLLAAVFQDEQLQELRKMRKFMERQIGKGQTKYMPVYIVGGAGMIHLDFLKTENTKIPVVHTKSIHWIQLNLPQALLFDLTIVNNGPGSIKLATNIESNSTLADTPLPSGKSINLKLNFPTIRTINLLAPDTDAQVDLIGLV